MSQAVEPLTPRHRGQPGAGAFGQALAGPLIECHLKGLGDQIFGQLKVTNQTDQHGYDTAVLLAKYALNLLSRCGFNLVVGDSAHAAAH